MMRPPIFEHEADGTRTEAWDDGDNTHIATRIGDARMTMLAIPDEALRGLGEALIAQADALARARRHRPWVVLRSDGPPRVVKRVPGRPAASEDWVLHP